MNPPTSLTVQSRLKLAEDVTHQSLGPGQDTVILSLASGYLYTCNRTTAEFLLAVDGRRTLAEVIACLEERFDVAPEKLGRDMLALAEKLLAEQLVQVVGP